MSQRFDDDDVVRAQYATPDNLRARKDAYVNAEGDDPREFVFDAVAAAKPQRVLEVGGGEGELAQRILTELHVELVAIDQSEGMVDIQRAKGIDAHVGDVRELPFADEEFDVAIAAWMLYHVADLGRGLAELARVLKPGGTLVAATNSVTHLQELRELTGQTPPRLPISFRSENGEQALREHFTQVQRRDARGSTTMDDATVRRFAASSPWLKALETMPPLSAPLKVRTRATVFVARKA